MIFGGEQFIAKTMKVEVSDELMNSGHVIF